MESDFNYLFIDLPPDFKLDENYILDSKRKIRRIFMNVPFSEEE
jgi:hypothetical protein